jgi:enoyl-CoA hydratase/carnithine racemase
MILPILAERLGLHQAKRWAITQATWQAGEAQSAGLVDQLVEAVRIEATIKRTLKNLGRLHPRGVVALKQYARRIQGMSTVSAMVEGQTLLSNLLGQTEVRAEVVAFRDYGILPGQTES